MKRRSFFKADVQNTILNVNLGAKLCFSQDARKCITIYIGFDP
jgi:hypothetical protein